MRQSPGPEALVPFGALQAWLEALDYITAIYFDSSLE